MRGERECSTEASPASRELEQLREREHQLVQALESRDVIGQAKGILMERMRIDAAGAFELLCHTSQHLNAKLIEIASELAFTGELAVCPCAAAERERPSPNFGSNVRSPATRTPRHPS